MSIIEALVVGIPARDEEASIGRCLTALVDAAGEIDVPIVVGVAADDCRDRTARVAARALGRARREGLDGVVVRTGHRAAGAARTAAIDAALDHSAHPLDRTWVATTDADTVVDRTWLAVHLAWARSGVDGVAGLVDVAWEVGDEQLAERYASAIATGGTGFGHEHVHGANLGLRADRWRAVGGCSDATVGEDGELWERLRASGSHVLGVDDLRVTTSARLTGRAPGGFARYLNDLLYTEDVG